MYCIDLTDLEITIYNDLRQAVIKVLGEYMVYLCQLCVPFKLTCVNIMMHKWIYCPLVDLKIQRCHHNFNVVKRLACLNFSAKWRLTHSFMQHCLYLWWGWEWLIQQYLYFVATVDQHRVNKVLYLFNFTSARSHQRCCDTLLSHCL